MLKGTKHHVYSVLRYSIGQEFYIISWDEPKYIPVTLYSIGITCLENDFVDIVFTFEHSNGSLEKYKYDDLNELFCDNTEDANRRIEKLYGIRLEEEC